MSVAAFLGAGHSTLSQVLRGTRRATVAQLRAWSRKLAITPGEIAVYLAQSTDLPLFVDDITSALAGAVKHSIQEART
jgi:transcriptional regulator with XRE-family HTH domain